MRRFLAVFCAVFVLVTVVHAEGVIEDEAAPLPETVDSVVSAVSDLVDSSSAAVSTGEPVSEVSSGGNTVYVLTQPSTEVDDDVSFSPVSIDDPGVSITDISLVSVAICRNCLLAFFPSI